MARIVIQIDGIEITASSSTNLSVGAAEGDIANLGLSSFTVAGAALDAGPAPSGPFGAGGQSNKTGVESEAAADAGRAPTNVDLHPTE